MPRRAAAAPVLEPEHHGRVTRPARPARRALTASARRVKLDDRKAVKAAAARQEWQEEAWAYFDEIPEVKFAILFVANIMSKLRLYAAAYPPDAPPEAKPIPVSAPASGVSPALAAAATAELARLRSADGGLADILARLALNLDVAGECHLVGFAATDEEPEEWLIASTSELTEKSGRLAILSQPDDKNPRVLDPEKDTAVRLWYKHGRWSGLADSHVRGVVSTCKTLDLLNRQVDAEALSYLPAGILAVPSEVEGRASSPVAEGADAAEDAAPSDPFLSDLEDALIAPVEESGSPAAMVPLVVRAPADALKELRHISLTRTSAQYLDGRIDRYINRLARGLYVPVEVIMGHMNTTFANAAQVDRDTWEDYLEPRAATIANALTHVFLRPNLVDSGAADVLTAARIVVWWDETPCISQPSKSEFAGDAHDRLAISDAAYRAAVHFGEEDAPEEEEVAERLARTKGAYPPELTAALLAQWAVAAGVKLPGVVEPGPEPAAAPAAPAADPGASFLDIANAVQKVYLGVGVVITVEEARDIINAAGATLGPPPPELLEAAGETPAAPADTPAIPVPPVAGAAGRRLRRTNAGEKLAAIDRELRSRLLVASNAAMTRALEKANARIRSRANGQRAALARVGPLEVAATLGPTFVAAATEGADLFEGAWDDLERQFLEWGAVAQRDALDIAGRVAGGFTIAQRAELGLRQAANLGEGWQWLKGGLTSLAGDRLFDPHPKAPLLGEHDPLLKVPPGAIRNAVAIAGGAPLQTTDGKAAFVTIGTAGGNIGGIGTGTLLGDAMKEAGASIEAYRWVYGPAQRQQPFKPHLRLDGKVFRHFDDPILANNHGFPSTSHFIPGDHAGCVCDVEPIILAAEEAIARGLTTQEEVAASRAQAPGDTPAPAAPADPPVFRPDPRTSAETAAEKWGVTVADLETARKQLPAYKAWVRAEAQRIRAEAIATLDRADALIMDRPLRGTSIDRALGKASKRVGGEYDWLEGLHADEVKRLRRGFRGENVGGYGPDNIADRLRQAGLVTEDALSDGAVIEDVWLPLNRQIDAMGAVARGKLPAPNAYGSFDVDNALALSDDAGIEWKPSILLDSSADDAAGYIARQWRDIAEEEARRTLGMSRYGGFVAEYGPAPWRMSFDSFADEVQDLLYTIDNVPGDAPFATARLRELVPDLLDNGQDLATLYDDIIATARLAGEDVAEWVEVY